ncbi:MAG TPA: sulfatase-like hydrolase/transferase, partial [Myxococcota bacterium]|nr:sulfatase-like hydrolase/transferase [Myxococcota bacterium]
LWDKVGRKADWLITADHGEEFGERGSWGHAQTLYSELLDVPLIAAGPDFPVGVRQEVVGHVDLAPTLAGLVGSTWSGPGVDIRKPVPERVMLADTSRFDTLRLSVEAGGHRLNVDRRSGDYELFDRQADPKELQILQDAAQQQALEALLLRSMGQPCQLSEGVLRSSKGRLWQGESWVEELVGPASFGLFPPDAKFQVDEGAPGTSDPRVRCTTTSTASSLDAETRKQLEALGYVQEGEE